MIKLDRAEVRVEAGDGEVTIVQPTDLELGEQRIAFIGANGSGKSSLARLLNGLVLPTSGSVTIHPNHARLDTKRDGAAVRRQVGFVFTDPRAQLVMPTSAEDVALSLRRLHPNKHERTNAALNVLEQYGLRDRADQSVHTLSGGQQQLLAIAGVLATEPSILVADEPTTLLDLRNSRLIGDLLLSIPQQLIVATHDLEFAARCDRVLVIENGTVAYDGLPGNAIEWYRERA